MKMPLSALLSHVLIPVGIIDQPLGVERAANASMAAQHMALAGVDLARARRLRLKSVWNCLWWLWHAM